MTKQELVNSMVEKTGLTKKACDSAVNAFTASVTEALAKGDKVALTGFGTFEVRARAARTGINPRTQKKISIAAAKIPAFKAGKALKDGVK